MATVQIWIAAFCTLAVFSFLYGENPVYRIAEHLFMGLAAAHMLVQGMWNVIDRAVKPLFLKGEWVWLPVVIGGIMLLCRWSPKLNYLSRTPLGFMVGVASALGLRRALDSEFYRQITSTISRESFTSVNSVIYIITLICTLSYFIYCYKPKSAIGQTLGVTGRAGQYMMMVAFGAALGSTVMARLSLVIERLQFLFETWLKLV